MIRVRAFLGLALVATGIAGHAAAAPRPWRDALAGDSSATIFLSSDGSLWRAPFGLGAREVFWTPRHGEHVVRLSVSPDGRHVAFITRLAEEDTSWIWIGGDDPPTRRGSFAPLLPYRWNRLHFEPAEPTISDRGVHGARFLQAGTRRWVRSSNTLDWTADARGAVFGYNDGVAFTPADSGAAVQVSRALPMDLLVLDPAPMLLVDAVVLREGIREGSLFSTPPERTLQGMKSMNEAMMNPTLQGEAWYLLYPASGQWRAFPASGLTTDLLWTASETSVWWVPAHPPSPKANTIRAVRAHDPTPIPEVQANEPVVWLGFDAGTRSLLWASGRGLHGLPEAGGNDRLLVAASSPIRRVIDAGAGHYVLCTRDSLLLVDAHAGTVRGGALAGDLPDHGWTSPGGDVIVVNDADHDHAPGLMRFRAGGALERGSPPAFHNARWSASPGRSYLLLYAVGGKPPGSIQVYDVAAGSWSEVSNPGINGWEEIPTP